MNVKVAEQLKKLVCGGVRTVSRMRLHLEQFVLNEFHKQHQPSRTNEAYFPSDDTIRNHIKRFLHKSQLQPHEVRK